MFMHSHMRKIWSLYLLNKLMEVLVVDITSLFQDSSQITGDDQPATRRKTVALSLLSLTLSSSVVISCCCFFFDGYL